jgi:hypothetical protein
MHLDLLLAAGHLDVKVRIAAVVATVIMFGVVLELVRRRRLAERYALVWMLVSGTLLVLAIWTELLNVAADALGIEVPANFLFIAAIGVAFLLLLHFSVITTRLSEETKILAQEVSRLDAELRAERAGNANGAPADGAKAGEAQAGGRRRSRRSASTSDQ